LSGKIRLDFLPQGVAREKLMAELCIAYTTFYEWRRETEPQKKESR